MRLLTIVILAGTLFAQDKPTPKVQTPLVNEPSDSGITKFIEPKYLFEGGDRLNRVINMVNQLSNARIVADSTLKIFVLKGRPEDIANAEQLLKRFDVPLPEKKSRQTHLNIYVVAAAAEGGESGPIPPVLSAPVEQLRTEFGYRAFKLIDTILLEGTEGASMGLSGLLPAGATHASEPTNYNAGYHSTRYSDTQKTMTIQEFNFRLNVPISVNNNTHYQESGIHTDLTIRDGQKLVLGKLTKEQDASSGVFLVLTARVD